MIPAANQGFPIGFNHWGEGTKGNPANLDQI